MGREFGRKLKELRMERGLTQRQLSEILGMDRTSVVKYETTDVGPSRDVLKRIAVYFGVSTDYLLGNDATAENRTIRAIRFAVDEGGLTEENLRDILDYAKMKYPECFGL